MIHANLGYMVYNNHSLSSGSTLRVGKSSTVNSSRIYTSHDYSLRAATTGEWCPFEKIQFLTLSYMYVRAIGITLTFPNTCVAVPNRN